MRRIDQALRSVANNHRQENYVGPLTSTRSGGHNANVNNLYNSQVRDARTVMPFGISSNPLSGVKAQTVVNDNSDNVVVGVYDPSRPPVGAGEICLYSTGNCTVYLSSGGIVSIESGSSNIDVERNKISIYNGSSEIEIKSSDINIMSGDTNIQIKNSGDIIIDSAGKVEMTAAEDITVKTDGELDITTIGDTNIETEGKIGITAVGDISVETEGKTNIKSVGDVMIETEGKTDIKSVGDMAIKSDGNIGMESAGNVEMKCSNLVVNNQTMIVP